MEFLQVTVFAKSVIKPWRRDMADMGWLAALLVPEGHDSLGLGLCRSYLVAEAAGRQLLNLPLAESAVLLPLLVRESAQPVLRCWAGWPRWLRVPGRWPAPRDRPRSATMCSNAHTSYWCRGWTTLRSP